MARRQSIGIRHELSSLISTRRLNFLAQLSGLVQRRRKVDPMALFWTIVLGFGAGRERTLAGLRRPYRQSTEATLVLSVFIQPVHEVVAGILSVRGGDQFDAGEAARSSGAALPGLPDEPHASSRQAAPVRRY